MENTLGKVPIPESFKKTLAANVAVFPTSLKLEEYLEYTPGSSEQGIAPAYYLPVGIKRLWFFEYCANKNIVGRIVPDVNIRFDVAVPGGFIGFATGKTDIYIGENLVASATAGQAFSLNEEKDLDNVIQIVTGIAQSKALTNAGFGAVPSTKQEDIPPQYPATTPVGSFGGQTASTNELPFTMGNDKAETGNPPPSPEVATATGAFNFTPMDQAKAMKWPFQKGEQKRIGKSLGELLATDPRAIYYLAAEWPGQSPAKEAAKLLLPDACKALGKPVPTNI